MQFLLFFILWATTLNSSPSQPGKAATAIRPEAFSVKLIAFKGKSDGARNILEWQTSSESDVREYIVEIAADGKEFVLTAWISPKGTAQGPATYKYIDAAPGAKTSYRLRIVGADGKEQLSNVITIKSEKEKVKS